MLGLLKRALGFNDGAPAAPVTPVPEIAADYIDVATPTDEGVKLKRQYELSATVAEVLQGIGMPTNIARAAFQAEPDYDFELREPNTPRDAARRFMLWLRAMDERGKFRSEQVLEMYAQFCLYDHRRPVQDNYFLNALERAPGVIKKRPLLPDGKRDPKWMWTLKPRPFSKALGAAMPKAPIAPPLPDNVVDMAGARLRQALAHDARRFARKRHRRNVRRGRAA